MSRSGSTLPRTPRHGFQLTVTQRYERELVALEDAARLAQLWEHALRASFDLGRSTGYQAGWIAGHADEAAAWQTIMTGYSELIRQPRCEELAQRRRPTNDPCSVGCGQCSRCTRASAARANLARYGQPDFPGTDVHPRAAHREVAS